MGWLQTNWLFSFSDYYDPENLRHGSLRVFNDDIVQAHTGFGTHPHEEMEIVSVILDGEMEHRDSMGNVMTLKKGDVQRMSAGTGITHSEMNQSDAPVSFFQIWIEPDTPNLTPSYDQIHFEMDELLNRFHLLASSEECSGVVRLNTDGKIFRGRWTADCVEKWKIEEGRALFLYVIEGRGQICGEELKARDQLRAFGSDILEITGNGELDLLLIDVPGKTT